MIRIASRTSRQLSMLCLCACAWRVAAAEPVPAPAPVPLPAGIEACAQLRIDAERLACYDKAVAPQVRGAAEAPRAADSAASEAVASASRRVAKIDDRGDFLDEYWELSPERKRGTFNFSGFKPNYFLPVHYTSGLNQHPHSSAPGHSGQLPDYDAIEAKLQISLRTKLLENVGLPGGDLWFAYTQQSLWQLYSPDISRPFRSTDHQPELFYIVPAPLELPLGWKVKMAGPAWKTSRTDSLDPFLAAAGTAGYALGGAWRTASAAALTARYNMRIHEPVPQDDNPDLTDYLGRTELVALWSPGAYVLGATPGRRTSTPRGSLQIDATMPLEPQARTRRACAGTCSCSRATAKR